MGVDSLRSFEFRREREASWRELEGLVDRAERRGLGSLGAEELYRLPSLHRGALASLSVARSISLDRNVLEYLEALAARSSLIVYANRRHLGTALRRFFGATFPALLWERRGGILLALGLMAAGVVAGHALTAGDMERFHAFVGADMADGRGPGSTRAELRETLFSHGDPADELTAFTSFLFSHNAGVGFLCFAAGFLAGVPVLLLLLTNGLLLGAMSALFASRGLAAEFWTWVLPHGVTELLAVALCGAAGLAVGRALVVGGRHGRIHALAAEGRRSGSMVIGAVSLFAVAALLEGFFRQLVHSVEARAAVAVLSATLWTLYVAVQGRRRATG